MPLPTTAQSSFLCLVSNGIENHKYPLPHHTRVILMVLTLNALPFLRILQKQRNTQKKPTVNNPELPPCQQCVDCYWNGSLQSRYSDKQWHWGVTHTLTVFLTSYYPLRRSPALKSYFILVLYSSLTPVFKWKNILRES